MQETSAIHKIIMLPFNLRCLIPKTNILEVVLRKPTSSQQFQGMPGVGPDEAPIRTFLDF